MTNFYKSDDCKMTCLMSIIGLEVSTSDPVIADHVEEKFREIKTIISDIIADGQSQGEIRRDTKPAELADFLVDSYNGALVAMKYMRSPKPLEQFLKINMAFLMP